MIVVPITHDASYLGVDIASDVIAAVRNKHEKGKIKGLVDLPIKFDDETSKNASLLRSEAI